MEIVSSWSGIILFSVINAVFWSVSRGEQGKQAFQTAPKKPQPASDRVLVSFKPGITAAAINSLHSQAGGKVLKKLSRINVEVVQVLEGKVSDAIKAYKKNPNVLFAEPNYRRTLTTTEGSLPAPYNVPNNFTEQWHLHNTGQGFGSIITFDPDTLQLIVTAPAYWGIPDADIDAPEGWELTHGSPDVKIAIIDSGVDCGHPDLNGKCIEQVNFVDEHGAHPGDLVGHGTHVASIAAAETDNSIGTAGVAWESKIGALKVCYGEDIFSNQCDDDDIIDAIIYASDHGYQIINMSLAGPDDSAAIKTAVDYAWDHGVVVVAGAGNDYGTTKYYPAAYPNVIGVAATDHYDNLAEFSAFSTDSDDWVSVAAPGDIIFAAVPGSFCDGQADCYDWKSGTSMATPVVAGIAAMVWSYIDSPTNAKVRECIEISAQRSGALGQNFLAWTKYGRVNLYNALRCELPINENPTALFNSAVAGLKVDFADRSFDQDGTIASWSWDFGDGGTSTEQNPSHTYAAAGTYTIKLTVTDNRNGVSAQFTNEVEVSDPETCADADGDGVPDEWDECEDTPANIPVNSKGCPAKPKIVVIPL